jgi:protein-disulfide isomerase
MDISIIDSSQVNTTNGIHIGNAQAPIKVIEFINVRCPYCKKWFVDYDQLLTNYVNEGKIERIIKPLDKTKESLQRGNVMHHYLDYTTPDAALAAIRQMFATQDEWKDMSLEEVAKYAETKLALTKQANTDLADAIVAEADEASIKFVPTVIIGEHIFDESINKHELELYLTEK